MRIACLAAVLAAVAWGAKPPRVGSLTTYSNQVVPLVIVGEGWSQQIVVSNVSGRSEAVTGTLKFFTREGKPWEVELIDRAKASTFLINIPTGGIAIYETITRDHEQILGWALLELTSSSGDCLTQSLWRKQTPGRPDLMTSVVASDRSLLPSRTSTYFNGTDGRTHGVGVLFAETCSGSTRCDQPNRFRARVILAAVLTERILELKPGVLMWMSLEAEFPAAIGKIGTFEVLALDGGPTFAPYLSAFALQLTTNTGAFTAVTPFEH